MPKAKPKHKAPLVWFLDDVVWYPSKAVRDATMILFLNRAKRKSQSLSEIEFTKERRKSPFPCDGCWRKIKKGKRAYLGMHQPYTVLCKECYKKRQ